ncbi:helix-turn-helix transcriptional regulator [Pseudomonas cichorii]|nr:helix-turn-helix transcriptional regulator [Pseudomonas cichorii]
MSKGMNQAELADAAGLESNTVSRYETAKRIPSIEHLLKIAEALDVSPMEILPPTDLSAQRLFALRQELASKSLKIKSHTILEELISAADAHIKKNID